MLRMALSSLVLVWLAAPASIYASPGATACQATPTYSGEAYGASVDVLFLHATLSDTGPLPASGGALSAQSLGVDLPGTLSAGLPAGNTTGGNFKTASQSSVANVNLTVAGIDITAAVLTANAAAQACGSGMSPTTSGSSVITSLTLNGIAITVTGEPNQTIPLLVGSLVINEQISAVTSAGCGSSANMTVNALHLTIAGIADVVISSSQAGVSCLPPQ